ncbi:MAG: PEPxxWA-CTERM sorting domain-containing protein [Roseiarcus sp.]
MQLNRGLIHAIGLAVAGLIATAGIARAQVTEADVGINPTFQQFGPTDVQSTGGFFSARAYVNSPADFAGGTLSYSGPGTPQTLTYTPADGAWEFAVGDVSFPELQMDFPTGGYEFALTGGNMGPAFANIHYDGDAYSNTPELTAASYNALQGMNPSDPLTVDFNMMEVSQNATEGANAIFFSITDLSTGTTVFSDALPTDATSVTIGSGTLAAGQIYVFDLLFDDRITGDDGNGTPITQFYDTHTNGLFATAGITPVPEPSTWAMMLIGFAGIGYAGYRSARKRSVAAAATLRTTSK